MFSSTLVSRGSCAKPGSLLDVVGNGRSLPTAQEQRRGSRININLLIKTVTLAVISDLSRVELALK
jgi:hypothetical protein